MIRPLFILGFLLVAGSTSAAEPADYSGRFEPVDLVAATADKEKAVDLATLDIPRLVRSFARSRLSQAASVTEFFEFVGSSNRMTTSSNRSDGWTTDLSATKATFTSDKGDRVTLTRWMSDGVLLTKAEVKKGSRSSRFELLKAGQTLSVTTTITNKHLSSPLVYRTEYRRVR
jgi:hypothetical protein